MELNNLDQNHVILDTCKDFIQKKESKINEDEDLGNIDYRKWIDHPKKLKKITKQMLESFIYKEGKTNKRRVICLQGTSTIDKHSDE
ncbi:hypothetical protein RhiirA5_417887 [Rhizophagus irregularis]|uniref:Uncharacterized protein n=1 Tax=Rhizophagus irregularis TaxID=588596 RepID=A0A2I1EQT7_9GLOM|nr:hypothetical protein RhiirA5_417887 [Rhizophagus irregularis]PKY24486.1 hypothetical protein RhiirB3_439065 [Rhizophagus irregularis]